MRHAVGIPGGASLPCVPPAQLLLPGMDQAASFGHAGPAMGQVLNLFHCDNTRHAQLREQDARHNMQLRLLGMLSQGGQQGFF